MPLRDIHYSHWTHITRKRFVAAPVTLGARSGLEALMRIEALDAPVRVFNGEETITISDVGYTWYQLALRDCCVWMHAAFDAEDRLVEVYFDITAGNRFDDPENPCFEDRYLDVVVTPAGGLRLLDRDELDQALAEGVLDREEYDAALCRCEELLRDLELRAADVLDFCRTHADALRRRL